MLAFCKLLKLEELLDAEYSLDLNLTKRTKVGVWMIGVFSYGLFYEMV